MISSPPRSRLVGDDVAAFVHHEDPAAHDERRRCDPRAARVLARDEIAGRAIEEVQVSLEVADDHRGAVDGGRAEPAVLQRGLGPHHATVATPQCNHVAT